MTIIDGEPKATFSIVPTPRCWYNSFPWIASRYLWYVPYNADCKAWRYIYIYIIGLVDRVFANGIQSQVESYQGLKTWNVMSSCLPLNIIRYGSRESGAIQRKEQRLFLHLGVVAIKKWAFESPSTIVSELIYIYMCVCVCVCSAEQKATGENQCLFYDSSQTFFIKGYK